MLVSCGAADTDGTSAAPSGSSREEPRRKDDPPQSGGPASRTRISDGVDSKIANPVQDLVNNAPHGDSDGHWQKKFDATRRALADQVAQNHDLKVRLASDRLCHEFFRW